MDLPVPPVESDPECFYARLRAAWLFARRREWCRSGVAFVPRCLLLVRCRSSQKPGLRGLLWRAAMGIWPLVLGPKLGAQVPIPDTARVVRDSVRRDSLTPPQDSALTVDLLG